MNKTSQAQIAKSAADADPRFSLQKADNLAEFAWRGANGSTYSFKDGSSIIIGRRSRGVTPVTITPAV